MPVRSGSIDREKRNFDKAGRSVADRGNEKQRRIGTEGALKAALHFQMHRHTVHQPMAGKTLRIYLHDGSPSSVLTAEIANWTGKVVSAPRAMLDRLTKRPESEKTGVYCLAGPAASPSNRELLYIGEADRVRERLIHHDSRNAKPFWHRTVIIVSKDENLTKSHGRYLESRLIAMAATSERFVLTNETRPEVPALPEPDVADMEYFLDQVQLILPLLGFDFFGVAPPPFQRVPVKACAEESPSRPVMLVLRRRGVNATARLIAGKVTVLKGSTARKQGAPYWKSYRTLREKLVAEGRMIDHPTDGELLIFPEDLEFASPSAASAVILGVSSNGLTEWRVESTGERLRDWTARAEGRRKGSQAIQGV